MSVDTRTSPTTGRTTIRVRWRLAGARTGDWQSVPMGHVATGRNVERSAEHKQATALDGWLRDVHGYAMRDDDPRIREFLGLSPKASEPTFAPTLAECVEAMHATKRKLADTSHANYTRLVKRLGPWAEMPADRFDHGQAIALFDDLESRYAPSTLHTTLGLLKSAVAKHVDVATVFEGIAYGKAEGTVKPVILTDDQVRALVANASECGLALPIFLTVNVGLRWSEMAGLQAKRVDLARGEIDVAEQLAHRETRKHGFAHKRLKTGASERVVPISAGVVEALALVAELPADAAVFAPHNGEWWLHPAFQYQWERLKARTPSVPAATRWHDLRHTCAMRWLRAGIPLGLVSRMLGHATVDVTADIYGAHWDATDHERIMAASMAW